MAASLALADEFWMVSHDKTNGTSHLKPKPLGIGLAAALLSEVFFAHWIADVDDSALYLIPAAETYQPPRDPAVFEVVRKLLAVQTAALTSQSRHAQVSSPGIDLGQTFGHLRFGAVDEETQEREPSAQELIEARLASANLVEEVTRGLLQSRTAYRPVSRNISAWPGLRVRDLIREGRELNLHDLTLAGVITATGLEKKALTDLGGQQFKSLAAQTARNLPRAVKQLLIAAETAIGGLVATR